MKKNKLKRIRRFFNVSLITLSVLLVSLLALVIIHTSDTTFNLSANTEQVEIVTQKHLELNWFFEDVILKEKLTPRDTIVRFSGFIKVPINSRITILRKGFGDVFIKFNKIPNSDFSVDLYNKSFDPYKTLTEDFTILIDSIQEKSLLGNTIVMPLNGLRGEFRTAPTPKSNESSANIPILRSGKVKLMKQSLLNTGLIENDSFDLQLGDQFIFNDAEHLAYGFIAINEKPNLSISYNVSGNNAVINKPGDVRRNISVSIINQIINDKMLSFISIFIGALFALITLLSFYIDYAIFIITVKNGK